MLESLAVGVRDAEQLADHQRRDRPTVARALRDKGVPMPEIAKKLTIVAGKNPSFASLYHALADEPWPSPDGSDEEGVHSRDIGSKSLDLGDAPVV